MTLSKKSNNDGTAKNFDVNDFFDHLPDFKYNLIYFKDKFVLLLSWNGLSFKYNQKRFYEA